MSLSRHEVELLGTVPPGRPGHRYVEDLETGKLVALPLEELGPLYDEEPEEFDEVAYLGGPDDSEIEQLQGDRDE